MANTPNLASAADTIVSDALFVTGYDTSAEPQAGTSAPGETAISSSLVDQSAAQALDVDELPPAGLTVASALLCEQLRIDGDAASALRIVDTVRVNTLPTELTIAVVLRVRGTPGRHELFLQLEGQPVRLYSSRLEITPGTSPYRTVLVPRLPLGVKSAGEQRLLIVSAGVCIGSLPLYVLPVGV